MFKSLKVFFEFVLKERLNYIAFMFLLLSSAIVSSISPYFYKLFTENIVSLNYQKLLFVLFLYMLARVVGQIVDLGSAIIGDKVLFVAATNARRETFNHVQDLDFAFHSNKSTGSLISAFKRGDSAFYNIYDTIHYNLLSVVVSLITMLYFFQRLNIEITLVILGCVVAIGLFLRKLIKNNIVKRNEFNDEEDNVSGIITDNLINFDTVKFFAKEDWERSRLGSALRPWFKTLWGYTMSFRMIDISMFTILNITVFSVLFIAIHDAVSGRLSIPDFVLIIGFVSSFFPQLWRMVWGFREIAKNYSDIEKYFALLDYKVKVADPINPVVVPNVNGNIEFKNIYFSYKGRVKNALEDINLSIKHGESIALVGKSGSGKTTLVRLLMRFYDPRKGEINLDGINIKNFAKSHLRSFIGLVPQEPILFNNTIAYNIGYAKPKARLSEIKAAAALANIDDFIEGLPKKYKTEVGERGVKLSGGQKQRLAIARVILADPQIIIFDEATSHLDSESERLIQDAFWKTAKNKTTLVIAHRLSTVKRADRIVVMQNGKIIETGTHNELLTKMTGVYKHLWDLQINVV